MKTIAANCNVFSSDNLLADLEEILAPYTPKQVFLMADEGSQKHCLNLISGVSKFSSEQTIIIKQGDDFKNVQAAVQIWEFLSSHGATRKSILVNVGGGMPCDLGGFCASTFKRGIEFINIPTTILAQVDASLGGKTGMNLGGLKNEIGVFSIAKAVVINSQFLRTLDKDNLLSGFAEMLKHALILDAKSLDSLMSLDFDKPDYDKLQQLICDSIVVKNHFVTEDPKEQGVRKALNFGHTFGHAFETFSMRHNPHPILHGKAVAFGMVCELMLSETKVGLDHNDAKRIYEYINSLYGKFDFSEKDFPELLELMTHDKKNDANGINFTLIPSLGDISINNIGTKEEITDVFRNYLNM
ncbi:MAG: 3-dehydroquinate synthase [Bacteroidales bacterium]|nr:3-dehydroquinate synthase [Bacteroidales bacterium]